MLETRSADKPGYGGVAKILHWLIVALLIVQFAIAWTMPGIHRGTQPERLINLHLSFGTVILLLVALRLVWRLFHPVPLVAESLPLWQQRGAQATHALLYLLLFALPITGWANASSRGWTIDLFGLVALPRILPTGAQLGSQIGDIHGWIAYALLGLAGLHVAAALYHHFWLRDRVLSRMLPLGREQ
jgi:cytochrome b561